jgi:hypothetical protein
MASSPPRRDTAKIAGQREGIESAQDHVLAVTLRGVDGAGRKKIRAPGGARILRIISALSISGRR